MSKPTTTSNGRDQKIISRRWHHALWCFICRQQNHHASPAPITTATSCECLFLDMQSLSPSNELHPSTTEEEEEEEEALNMDEDSCFLDLPQLQAAAHEENHHLDISYLVKRKDLNMLKRLGGVENLASLLHSDLQQGINVVPAGRDHEMTSSRPFADISIISYLFSFLRTACMNWNILLLAVAALLTFVIDIMEHGIAKGWHNGAAIFAVTLFVVIATSVRNFVIAKKHDKKWTKVTNSQVLVRRGGNDLPMLIFDVVEGDVVKISKGSIIPGDGLLIDGDNLVLDDDDDVSNPKINPDDNPFLFLGSRVMSGTGSMLITSTANDTNSLLDDSNYPNKASLPENLANEANNYIEMVAFGLFLSILVVVLIRDLFPNHLIKHGVVNHCDKPEIKGDVSVKQMMDLFKKIVSSRCGILVYSLAAMMMGLQHGVPYVISMTLSYWNSKVKNQAQMLTLSASATMGLVTLVYVDTTSCIGHVLEDIKALQDFGIKIIMEGATSSLPFSQLNDIKQLKESGHVVAFYGGSTASIPSLREADLGITGSGITTQLAKGNSGIYLINDSIHALIQSIQFGRCAIDNIRGFLQLQLISSVSWLLVILALTISSGDSSWTPFHQIWMSLVFCTLGALMMRIQVADRPPTNGRTTLSLLQKSTWFEVATQVSCQVLVFLVFIYCGGAVPSFGSSTVRSTMVFASFTLCQVFNQVMIKAIYPIPMGDPYYHQHCLFYLCSAVAVVCQVVAVEFAGRLSYGATLTVKQWTMSFFLAVLPWILHRAVKLLLDRTLRLGIRLFWLLIWSRGLIVDICCQ